jgi:hypothetical protein
MAWRSQGSSNEDLITQLQGEISDFGGIAIEKIVWKFDSCEFPLEFLENPSIFLTIFSNFTLLL